MSDEIAKIPCCLAKGKNVMDYVVVLATMLMIAGYACIIGRALRGTE